MFLQLNTLEELEKLKEEVSVLNKSISAIKDWIKDELDDLNDDIEEVADSVSVLETDDFIVKTTLDEAFSSLIILKEQMKQIFPHWCEKCNANFKELKDFKMHKKTHKKEKEKP